MDQVRTRLADGRVAHRQVGEVRIRLDGGIQTTPAIFGRAKDATVIGVVTLESMGLTVDPTRHRLISGEYLMMSSTPGGPDSI